jgi:hypothetical protein
MELIMKKKTIIAGMIFFLFLIYLIGCVEQNNNENKIKEYESLFIGNWERSDGKIITFYKNSSYFTKNPDNTKYWGIWDLLNDTYLLLYVRDFSGNYKFEFVGDDRLIFTDISSGKIDTYIRIE